MVGSLNLYFDSVSAIGQRYDNCKQLCLVNNATLAKEVEDSQQTTIKGQKTKYFDPMSSDPCLSECRAQFYFVYRRVNKYLVEDRGLYIEQCADYSL